MRKSIVKVFCIFMVFCLLVGCSGSPETKAQDKQEIGIDDSTTDTFEENTIQVIGSATISGTGKIKIKGDFQAGDGVLIKRNSSRALTRSEDESDTQYYQTGSGYYLVMAEKDGEIEIEPENMNLSDGDKITIGKFKNENDFAITTEEFSKNNVRNIAEEYYYVDFNSDEFATLDKKDIVVRQTLLSGGSKVCIVTRDNGTQANVNGSVNYSNETGIGILQSASIGTSSTQPPARVHVVTPINLSFGDTDKKLTNLFSIIRIKADSLENGKEYCLRITGMDKNTIAVLAKNRYFQKTLLRNEQGRYYGLAIPYFSIEDDTITYYIGSLTEDRMIDIDFEVFYTGLESVDYSISIIEKPETILGAASFTDVTSAGSTEVTLTSPYSSTDILTVPYKASEKSKVKMIPALTNFSSYGYFYHRSDNNSGHGSMNLYSSNNADFYAGTVGYFVITLTKGEVKEGDAIVTIEKKAVEKYKPGYVYVFDTEKKEYASDTGEVVDGVNMIADDEGEDFISGSFVCNSTEEQLAGLSMKNGFYYCGGSSFGHCSINNNGTDGRTVQHGYKEDDPTLTYFFEVEEFRYMSETDKSITGTMILLKDNTEIASFKNVSFVWEASTES